MLLEELVELLQSKGDVGVEVRVSQRTFNGKNMDIFARMGDKAKVGLSCIFVNSFSSFLNQIRNMQITPTRHNLKMCLFAIHNKHIIRELDDVIKNVKKKSQSDIHTPSHSLYNALRRINGLGTYVQFG